MTPRPSADRAILYLRQSVAREDSISLELQEAAGRAHCEQRGYSVVGVEADPGISGRTWKRPAVQRVMTAIESRQAEVIVLWKWSRLSRRRLDWAVAAERVEKVGGRIESATEPLDTATAVGRLARGMMTEIAAFESERIGDGWREAHARRIRNGLPANGKPRFGYEYSRADGFTPDPVTGPILAQLYRRYSSGASIYELTEWLNAESVPVTSSYGASAHGQWTDTTLRRMLDSGFGAGFIRSSGELLPGAHRGVITAAEWDAYLEARNARRVRRSGERSEYAYSGLVRCHCGARMHAQRESNGLARYRCSAAKERRAHPGGYIWESKIDGPVATFVASLAHDLDPAIDIPAPAKVVDHGPAILRAQGRLDKLTLRYAEGEIPTDSYQRLRDSIAAEIARLERDAIASRVIPATRPTLDVAVVHAWPAMDARTRRDVLRRLIASIDVAPGRGSDRVTVRPVWGD
ncbi:recombinase family protein [Agrococcus sp. Marseille-Q4369]|uniref:recombinase family protein n=1 Tax=Agrococcus sp. Marseille-Q4369 TaxID=2810513 RepID=UPI001B8C0DBD|nr:recombinase family protein [Agrococcus sp. Marseille-Q4369]QUW18854.1 recombinase family protein [Agrococcus sp. Marseille-Q4369]